MKIPRSRALRSLRQVVRMDSIDYTVTRGTDAKGRFGESNTADTTSTHTVSVKITSATSSAVETEYGDRLTGALTAYGIPPVDLQRGDQLDHDGTTYEVTETLTIPQEDERSPTNALFVAGLTKVVNSG